MERLTSEPPPRRAAGWLRGVNEVVHSAISSFLSVPHAPKLLAVHLGWCYGSKAALNCCYWSTVTLYMLKALILHNVWYPTRPNTQKRKCTVLTNKRIKKHLLYTYTRTYNDNVCGRRGRTHGISLRRAVRCQLQQTENKNDTFETIKALRRPSHMMTTFPASERIAW
jgi:hypothetical protein